MLLVAASTLTGYGIGAALDTKPVSTTAKPVTSHGLQGGGRQTVQQPYATIDRLQPADDTLSASYESADNLQPTLTAHNLQ